MTGSAMSSERRGRSPSTSQASNATITTCRFVTTVPRPAPMSAIE